MKKKLLVIGICSILFFNNCTAPVRTTPTPRPEPPVKVTPKPPPPPPPKEEAVVETPTNTLTTREVAEGWRFLFDGLTTDGWHTYGSRSIGTAWKTVNGTLFLDAESKKQFRANTGGDIVTDEEFGNFELKLDWKIAKNGNSGICFYVKEDGKASTMWQTGPEMQILDNNGHPDGKIIKHRTGDLYDLISASSEPVKRVGEWNNVMIRSVNGKLDFYLNNVHILSTTMWTDNWRSMIANSKFRDMPGFGKHRVGRIGLQDHGDNVWFRNIKIRRL